MVQNLEKAKDILKKYHQEHLLAFYDELNNKEKAYLLNQICSINFEQILNLYEASKIDEVLPSNLIEPLPYNIKREIPKDKFALYENIGIDAIKGGKFAVVTMAGGQGTRLGYKGPKGVIL